jgi:N utilization substance protein A
LGKKAEGRPITPEEYRELHLFNNRVESGLIEERREVTKQQKARIQAAREAVPDDAYDLPIMTLGLPTKVENLLDEAGLINVGDLAYRLLLVPDSISDIDGIGPSYVSQIESALEVMIGYEPLSEEFDIDEELILPGTTAAAVEESAEDESGEAEEESSESEEDTKESAEASAEIEEEISNEPEEESPESDEESPESDEESPESDEESPESDEESPESDEEELPEDDEGDSADTEEEVTTEVEEEEVPEADEVESPEDEEESSNDDQEEEEESDEGADEDESEE